MPRGAEPDISSDTRPKLQSTQPILSLAARLGLKDGSDQSRPSRNDDNVADLEIKPSLAVSEVSLGARLLVARDPNSNKANATTLHPVVETLVRDGGDSQRMTASMLRSQLLSKRISNAPAQTEAMSPNGCDVEGGEGKVGSKRERPAHMGDVELGKGKILRGSEQYDRAPAALSISELPMPPTPLPSRPITSSIPDPASSQDPKEDNRREQLKRLNAAYTRIRTELEELKTSSDDAHHLKDQLQESKDRAASLEEQLEGAKQEQKRLEEGVLHERAGRRVAETKLATAQRELTQYRVECEITNQTQKHAMDNADAATSLATGGARLLAQLEQARQAAKGAEQETKEAHAKLAKLGRSNSALQTLRKSATDRADALNDLNAALRAQLESVQAENTKLVRSNGQLRLRADDASANADKLVHANIALRAQVELLWGQLQQHQMRQLPSPAETEESSRTVLSTAPFVLGAAGLRVEDLVVDQHGPRMLPMPLAQGRPDSAATMDDRARQERHRLSPDRTEERSAILNGADGLRAGENASSGDQSLRALDHLDKREIDAVIEAMWFGE